MDKDDRQSESTIEEVEERREAIMISGGQGEEEDQVEAEQLQQDAASLAHSEDPRAVLRNHSDPVVKPTQHHRFAVDAAAQDDDEDEGGGDDGSTGEGQGMVDARDPEAGLENLSSSLSTTVHEDALQHTATVDEEIHQQINRRYHRMIGSRLGQGRKVAGMRLPCAFNVPASPPFPASESASALYFDATKHKFAKAVVDKLSAVDSNGNAWAGSKGKVSTPQKLVARILSGDTKHKQSTEAFLLRQRKPWGRLGSSHPFHLSGDYDFTSIGLAFILHRFDTTLVSREVKDHVQTSLLPPVDESTTPRMAVPRAMMMSVLETENHLLMVNGTLYLTARYLDTAMRLAQHPRTVAKKVQLFLKTILTEMKQSGLWEFNSLPYLGYTVIALLILDECSHAEAIFQPHCREVLDYIVFTFALGSFKFKRWAPYRRRTDYRHHRSLFINSVSHMMLVWAERAGLDVQDYRSLVSEDANANKAVYAAACRYTPAREVLLLAAGVTTTDYYARLGHGSHSSPELFSAGPGWLLSAGGVSRARHEVVGRETVLFLDAYDTPAVDGCIHLSGAGSDWRRWNNTALVFNVAITAGKMHVPSWLQQSWVAASSRAWTIYCLPRGSPVVALYRGLYASAVAVFDQDVKVDLLLDFMLGCANSRLDIKGEFLFPPFACMAHRHHILSFNYDLTSPHSEWAITAVNGEAVFRDMSSWPLIDIAGQWRKGVPESHLKFLFSKDVGSKASVP